MQIDMHDYMYVQAQLMMNSMAVCHKKVYMRLHHKAFSILNVCAWLVVMQSTPFMDLTLKIIQAGSFLLSMF